MCTCTQRLHLLTFRLVMFFPVFFWQTSEQYAGTKHPLHDLKVASRSGSPHCKTSEISEFHIRQSLAYILALEAQIGLQLLTRRHHGNAGGDKMD